MGVMFAVLRLIPWWLILSVLGHGLLLYLLGAPGPSVKVMRISLDQGRTTIDMRATKPKLTKKELDVAQKELPIERDAPKPTPVTAEEIPPPREQALLEMPKKRPEEEVLEEPKPIERLVRPPEVQEVAEVEAVAMPESVAQNAAVDVKPSLHRNPTPSYPADAYARRQTGEVMLKVRVGADGRAKSVEIHRSSGVPSLDEAARRTVRDQWTFHPARRGKEAVEHDTFVPVEFRFKE